MQLDKWGRNARHVEVKSQARSLSGQAPRERCVGAPRGGTHLEAVDRGSGWGLGN